MMAEVSLEGRGIGMKGLLKYFLIGVLIIAALLINPRDIYFKLTAEKEIINATRSYLIRKEYEGEEIEIKEVKYLGGNVYFLETDGAQYLIKRERISGSSSRYDFYVYQETLDRKS